MKNLWLFVCWFVISASCGFGQSFDTYGGSLNLPCSSTTGYFHTEKINKRWWVCTPLGHAMWVLSVYVMDSTDGGTSYSTRVATKYPGAFPASNSWPAASVQRIKDMGFNVIGPYAGVGGHNMLPLSTYNSPPNPVKLPFLLQVDIAEDCMKNSAYKTKNLYNGLNPAVDSIGRDFPDVFDPNWASCVSYDISNNRGGGVFTPLVSTTEPYMLGIWLEDADYLYGLGAGPSTPGKIHAHLGWIAAITSPTQASGPGGEIGTLYSYTDASVHTKAQWQTYVQTKYSTVAAMNAAWGSTYTTFGSAGGWPKKTTGGSGLMDEDGSSSWVPFCDQACTGGSSNMLADFNSFLSSIANEFFSVARTESKAAYPNHMVFGPGSINSQTWTQVLQAAGKYMDVVEVYVEPLYLGTKGSNLANAYNLGGAPLLVWSTLQSSDSSANTTNWGSTASTCNISGLGTDYTYTTQALRGQCYQELMQAYLNTTAADSSHPVVGVDWWEFADKVTGGENANFGLVSDLDNPYDGVCDITGTATDKYGFSCGGEAANHGNFITGVEAGNALWFRPSPPTNFTVVPH